MASEVVKDHRFWFENGDKAISGPDSTCKVLQILKITIAVLKRIIEQTFDRT